MLLTKKNIAIFASGGGSNAKAIITASQNNDVAYQVALIVTNNPTAGVLQIAKDNNISTLIIDKQTFYHTNNYTQLLQQHSIDLVVLAGFLWKVPVGLVQAFNQKIINIHPALLPKYGGKGMYGNAVHEAVIANNDTQSGITIHQVNEVYDDGKILLQATCAIAPNANAATLAAHIHQLEHQHYWLVIHTVLAQ